tara:strand:+ start:146 stop:544 length:399 start_codon:yes stop_codon:yes gene_type:complete
VGFGVLPTCISDNKKPAGFLVSGGFSSKALLCGSVENRYHLSVAVGMKFHFSITKGKECEVLAHANVLARVKTGSALAQDNVPRNDGLAAKFLDSQTLAVAVASVLGGALPFFVCHLKFSFSLGSTSEPGKP